MTQKIEFPEWRHDGIWGRVWYSTRGNREDIINHMVARIPVSKKEVEEMLDHFLKENPEAVTYFDKKLTTKTFVD